MAKKMLDADGDMDASPKQGNSLNGSKSVHNYVVNPKADSRNQTRGPSVNPGTKARGGKRGK